MLTLVVNAHSLSEYLVVSFCRQIPYMEVTLLEQLLDVFFEGCWRDSLDVGQIFVVYDYIT